MFLSFLCLFIYQSEATKTSLTAMHLYIYCTHVNRKKGGIPQGIGLSIFVCASVWGMGSY